MYFDSGLSTWEFSNYVLTTIRDFDKSNDTPTNEVQEMYSKSDYSRPIDLTVEFVTSVEKLAGQWKRLMKKKLTEIDKDYKSIIIQLYNTK